MSNDLLQNVRIATIPVKLKITGFLAAVIILALNMYVIQKGLGDNREFWVVAGSQLLAVLLPIILILVFLQFAHSGGEALIDRTQSVLIDKIPRELSKVVEHKKKVFKPYQHETGFLNSILRSVSFSDRRSSADMLLKDRPKTCIEICHVRGDCFADYRLLSEGKEIYLRVELIVKRANVNICIPEAHYCKVKKLVSCLAEIGEKNAGDEAVSHIADPLKNTLVGAKSAGYSINPAPIERVFDGNRYCAIVLARQLAPDFLWDPAEQLYFCQDLMFMLRAILSEWNFEADTGAADPSA
ncbi:hypothetical protein [Niveispirillum cyanobacteriorum]|uniref:Uncharacterized protein n=1 Tax=Niveispirillum cyanobacteriorum TaxID=1612173 RepID=A0A2K9NBS4_9PROT|nr:hypothetical protein [Niveispirillum cyanobacteriorum]AUN30568.1 hypothetical protein C0V82_10210 [Niveispirillum cyanobacteriorum]